MKIFNKLFFENFKFHFVLTRSIQKGIKKINTTLKEIEIKKTNRLFYDKYLL